MTINVIRRKDIVNKNNTSPLFLRLTHNRRTKYVALGVSVLPEHWDDKAQCFTDSCPEKRELQTQTDLRITELHRKIKRLEALDMEVNFENLLDRTTKCTPQFVEAYFERQIEQMKRAGKINTAIKYAATRTSLCKFRPARLRFEDITPKFLSDFAVFLHDAGNRPNSIATKFSVLKAVYNKAVADKIFICKDNPFAAYKVGKHWTQTHKRAVHKEDVQRLIDAELPAKRSCYTEFARDIFLFSYFSAGINFKDIATLRYADIEDGRIFYRRHKTGKQMNCRLMPQAHEIMAKYRRADAGLSAEARNQVLSIQFKNI